jgi:4-amino-4-deoxy-L-arabinose transferase-like glycosyltransferase
LFVGLASLPKLILAILGPPFGLTGYGAVGDFVQAGAHYAGYPDTLLTGPFFSFQDVRYLYAFAISLVLRLDADVRTMLYANILLNAATGFAVYWIAKEMIDRETGLMAACLTVLNWHLWWYSQVVYDTSLIVFLVTLSIGLYYSTIRGNKLSGAILPTVLFISFIANGVALILPLLFATHYVLMRRWTKQRPQLRGIFVGLALAAVVLAAYLMVEVAILSQLFGFELNNLRLNRAPFSFLRALTSLEFYASKQAGMVSLPLLIFAMLGLLISFRKKRSEGLLLLLWIGSLVTAFSVLVIAVDDRYMAAWEPALIVASAWGMRALLSGKKLWIVAVLIGLSTVNTEAIPLAKLFPFSLRGYYPAPIRILENFKVPLDPELVKLYATLTNFHPAFAVRWYETTFLLSLAVSIVVAFALARSTAR